MNGGAIFGNTVISATGNGGGGVCVSEGTTFTMTGGSIHDNAAASNGNGVYDAGTFTVSPATGAAFSIADIIYLANGRLVNIGASIANITGVLNVVASPPAVGNAIAQSAPGYTLSTADARKIMYNSGIGGWYTLLSPTGATIILGRESGIFLDGVNGDDDNEGTSWNNPVQTLSVALDKAGIVNTVYVVNTVTVDSVAVDDSAASGRQITIARSVSNNNPLFNVTGGALTLSYVTVDGNTANNFVNDSSLVNVSGGSFTLSGATLQNNTGTNGGAIYIGESGSVIITGGKITDNTATLGNGIYVAASNTLTLSPSGTGAITFGEDDAIYLPYNSGATTPQVSFNIGEDLDPGVASDVPLAFQNPMSDETVAIALTETMAENSYEKLVSGEMVFYPDDIYIKIEVTL
jgi:hypothetical protein